MLEPTRGKNVLDIVLSSQKEFVDNVNICEPLGCSDHNQISQVARQVYPAPADIVFSRWILHP